MIRLIAGIVLLASGAVAQETDCTNQITQLDMNICAQADYEAADQQLNDAYRIAISTAREMDQAALRGIEDTLRAAQRAWVTFRDAACEAEARVYEGGSIAPLVRSTCLTQLTVERTQGLTRFAGDY